MSMWIRGMALVMLATAAVVWCSGCSKDTKSDHKDHKDHKDDGKKDHGKEHGKEGHDHKALTEKDVKLPDSFPGGVARLEELHKKIEHHIEHNELKDVHRTAEEMVLVANKTKEMAQKTVAEDKLADAGRLCNQVAGYFKPIDEAADAGKKSETETIHKKMGETIGKLKALAK